MLGLTSPTWTSPPTMLGRVTQVRRFWSVKMAEPLSVDWAFNAWGGNYDGLYQDYESDDQVASRFSQAIGLPVHDAHPFVLEGGAIHSDGEGTILVTESCLLSQAAIPI